MRYEKSAGVVIFRIEGDAPLYLLLHGPLKGGNYWGFAKGLIEKGESEEETAMREAEEEAGLKVAILPGFKAEVKYMFKFSGELISKEVVFFVAESKSKNARLSDEHDAFKWLSYGEALKLMKFKNHREVLVKANDFICEWVKQKKLA